MSTFADLIEDVKVQCRETTTEKDAFLLASANRIYRQLLRSDAWPQSRSYFSINIVTGTVSYDLPADFDRFAGERVNYQWNASADYPAQSIPIVTRGTATGDTLIGLWEGVGNVGYPYTWPSVVAIQQKGTAGTFQLVLYPASGTTGDILSFDYYAVPTRDSITTATVINPDQLYETMVAALSGEYSAYIDDMTLSQRFGQQAQLAHRNARRTLSTL